MPNYLTLVLHVYPAKVSLRPVRLGNGLRPLPPSPAGLVATWHPAGRRTGFSSRPRRARVSQDSRTPRGPASNRLPLDSKTRTLHILNLPGQFPHCSITCWHTPSFPGKASQETGTLALAGPIQPAPRYVALTLIPRENSFPIPTVLLVACPRYRLLHALSVRFSTLAGHLHPLSRPAAYIDMNSLQRS